MNKEISPLAIASLAFSCMGALTLGILSIPGIICGMLAKAQVRRGEYGGHSLAQAGVIVGVVVLALWVVIPALILGGFLLRVFAGDNPWIGFAGFSILILLALFPFIFAMIARHRESTLMRRMIAQNRDRN